VISGCTGTDFNAAYIMTALAFGLVIVAMAYSIGNISGCHINPAVTLGAFLTKQMSLKDCLCYMVSQFCGGIVGAGCLSLVLGDAAGSLGTNGLYNNNIFISLLVEVLLTFVFVYVILWVTSKKEYDSVAGLIIGLTLTLVHIFGIHFTGTSVNPARSFGPALFVGGDAFLHVWIFIVGPLLGGALAAICHKPIGTKE